MWTKTTNRQRRFDKLADRLRAKLEENAETNQFFKLAEEAGEAVARYTQWKGWHRRSNEVGASSGISAQSARKQLLLEELADVVITAYVAAEMLGVDLDPLIDIKLDKIDSRGL